MSNPETKIEVFMKSIRNSPFGRQIIPMECITGWPILMRKNGRIYIKLLYFKPQQKEKGKTGLYPPLLMIVAEYETGRIVEYSDLRLKSIWPDTCWEAPVGYFPHEAIAQMKVSEYKQLKNDLMQMYDQMIDTMLSGSGFSEEWERQFSGLLSTVIEPPLVAYYKELGEKFISHFLV